MKNNGGGTFLPKRLERNKNKVIELAAVREPTETILKAASVIAKTVIPANTASGSKAAKTPAPAKTPFPTLKPAKMVKIWPKTAARPQPRAYQT